MPGSRLLGAVIIATGTAVGGVGVFTMTARADTTISARQDGNGGWMLVDQNGSTVYGYTQDPYDRSKCNGDCTNSWKPVPGPLTGAGEGVDQGKLSTIKREDGSMQAAYDRRPLYTYTGDQQSGDRKGQGAADQWYVIGTNGELNKSLAAASAAQAGGQPSPGATDGNGQGQDGQNGDGTGGDQDGSGGQGDGSGDSGSNGGQNGTGGGNGQDGTGGNSGQDGSGQNGTGGNSGQNGDGGDSGQGNGGGQDGSGGQNGDGDSDGSGGNDGGELPRTGAFENALATGGASLLLIGSGLVLVSRPTRRQGR